MLLKCHKEFWNRWLVWDPKFASPQKLINQNKRIWEELFKAKYFSINVRWYFTFFWNLKDIYKMAYKYYFNLFHICIKNFLAGDKTSKIFIATYLIILKKL